MMADLKEDELVHVLKLLRQLGLEVKLPDGTADKRHTAHHEAGHAMVGRALGGVVESISIAQEGRAAQIGHADHEEEGLEAADTLRRVEVVAKTLLAGPIAERRCSGACQGWGGDVPKLATLLASHPHPKKHGTTWLSALLEATNALVNTEWERVRLVADELLKKETLTGEQVEEVLKRPRPRLER
jgi:ATP-dependent Zn protease